MFRTLLLCVALIFPTLVHAQGAAPHRLPDRAHRPARRRRPADGGRHQALPQGAQQHPRRPQGRAVLRRHRRPPGARRPRPRSSSSATRCTSSSGRSPPSRRSRSTTTSARPGAAPVADPRRRRTSTQRKPNPFFVRSYGTSASRPPLGEYAATNSASSAWRSSPTTSPTATRPPPASSACSRTTAARSCSALDAARVPDYGSFIAQLKNNVDAVYAGFAGANGFRFLRPYKRVRPEDAGARQHDHTRRRHPQAAWATKRSALSPAAGTPPASTRRTTRNSSPRSARNTTSRSRLLHRRRLLRRRCGGAGDEDGEGPVRGQGRLHEGAERPAARARRRGRR